MRIRRRATRARAPAGSRGEWIGRRRPDLAPGAPAPAGPRRSRWRMRAAEFISRQSKKAGQTARGSGHARVQHSRRLRWRRTQRNCNSLGGLRDVERHAVIRVETHSQAGRICRAAPYRYQENYRSSSQSGRPRGVPTAPYACSRAVRSMRHHGRRLRRGRRMGAVAGRPAG